MAYSLLSLANSARYCSKRAAIMTCLSTYPTSNDLDSDGAEARVTYLTPPQPTTTSPQKSLCQSYVSSLLLSHIIVNAKI
jgi:hypothetical protein